ncbi:MAG: hypothetical protein LKF79_07255 [Solobacterium sp.]|nr:hypothetical protein [Solobacterium sp.]MCH4222187.1 hypothetical protein [Solobacterium sp.]MCH4266423.1 hypothetical protein [Solobacterium sp.]
MKRFSAIILSAALLCGCSSSTAASSTAAATASATPTATAASTASTVSDENKLSIIAPYGAPSLAMIPAFQSGYDVTTVDGADSLQAAFINPDPEYDVIIAPTNLGMKLNQAGKTTYKLLDVVTWGNLYIVGDSDDALTTDGEMAAFGEDAVSGLVFKSVYSDGVTPNITWYNSVSDAQAALLSGKANVALLAEPAATATIAKAKENGTDLKIIADLQESFNDGQGYPQAGLFVREDDYNANPDKYANLEELLAKFSNNIDPDTDSDTIIADVNEIGTDVLGVPSGEIVAKVWKRLNIKFTSASSCKDEINSFMNLFGVDNPDGIIG